MSTELLKVVADTKTCLSRMARYFSWYTPEPVSRMKSHVTTLALMLHRDWQPKFLKLGNPPLDEDLSAARFNTVMERLRQSEEAKNCSAIEFKKATLIGALDREK
jgi:hypothetical protein